MDEMTYSAGEVAERFGVGEPAVRGWARGGLLPGAYQVGRTWRIPESTLSGFTPPKRGRKMRGRNIRFVLSDDQGAALTSRARLAGISPSEEARRIVAKALSDGRNS